MLAHRNYDIMYSRIINDYTKFLIYSPTRIHSWEMTIIFSITFRELNTMKQNVILVYNEMEHGSNYKDSLNLFYVIYEHYLRIENIN